MVLPSGRVTISERVFAIEPAKSDDQATHELRVFVTPPTPRKHVDVVVPFEEAEAYAPAMKAGARA